MPRRRLAAVGMGTIVLLLARGVAAQDVYELYAPTTDVRSTVAVSDQQLEVFTEGVLYIYKRDPRFDARGMDAYYNTTLAQVIRWPHSNQGALSIGTETAAGMRYRASEMEIVGPRPSRRAAGPAPPGQSQVVVIESALPGAGLVSARFGGRGNIEIGSADPQAAENQFYLQPEGNGYVSIVPAAQPALVIDIANSAAFPGANVDLWRAAEVDPDAAQFRLMPNGNGHFFLESKLQPGVVWDVDGALAEPGANVRLMRNHGGASQLFRISLPQNVQGVVGGRRPGVGAVVVVPPRPATPLRPARVKFANSHDNELWVVLVDRRAPDRPQRLKIPASTAITVSLSRDAGAAPQVLYEVSVYELIRQSVAIDATARGRGAVIDENFSPQSVGWFEIPPGSGQGDGVVDVYRLARRGGNPGRVAGIDVDEWADVIPGEAPMAEGDVPAVEVDASTDEFVDVADDDPDSPFGVVGETDEPAEAAEPVDAGLNMHLAPMDDESQVPPYPIYLGLVRRNDGGDYNVERMAWIVKEVAETFTVQTTKEVEVDGEIKTITEEVPQVRTKDVWLLEKVVVSLQFEQLQVFLPDGTELDEAATANALQAETPAVLLRSGEQLDPRYLPLLQPTTPVIVYDNQAGESPPEAIDEERRPQFPSTPAGFRSAKLMEDGSLQLYVGYAESVVITEQFEVPVTETRVVDGKEVEVTIVRTELRDHAVEEWRQAESVIPADLIRVYTMAGQRNAAADATAQFARPKIVVYLAPDTIIDPWYRKVFRPETPIIVERPPRGAPAP